MKEKQVSILSRPQLMDTPHNSFFQRAVSLARNSWIGHGRDSTIYSREDAYVDPGSSGASYRREVFEKVGYFDLSFDACEDVEFNYRCAEAGFRSFTSMKLAVYYYPRTSLRGLFRQMRRYGAGRFRLARKHPETLSITTLFPALLVLGLPSLGLLGFLWPVLAVSFWRCTSRISDRHSCPLRLSWPPVTDGPMLFALPAIYVAIHSGPRMGIPPGNGFSGCSGRATGMDRPGWARFFTDDEAG